MFPFVLIIFVRMPFVSPIIEYSENVSFLIYDKEEPRNSSFGSENDLILSRSGS
jgi:hypothetical protein